MTLDDRVLSYSDYPVIEPLRMNLQLIYPEYSFISGVSQESLDVSGQ